MLSSGNDTSRHSITARAAQRRSPINPPDRCPHCNSKRLIKKGTRKKKLEDVPLYRCRSCGRTFAPGPRAMRNKTYPLPEILEAFMLYDRGNTLEETAEGISSEAEPIQLTKKSGESRTKFLHIAETDCVAGHIGFELRCAK
jgi:transposase-like protein